LCLKYEELLYEEKSWVNMEDVTCQT
jgi:hypothetical protein